jgi:transcription initiation factor TFIIIB Brf1 subunit/transcription initiation factor TFIIB
MINELRPPEKLLTAAEEKGTNEELAKALVAELKTRKKTKGKGPTGAAAAALAAPAGKLQRFSKRAQPP